jgi:hypothetical protein
MFRNFFDCEFAIFRVLRLKNITAQEKTEKTSRINNTILTTILASNISCKKSIFPLQK